MSDAAENVERPEKPDDMLKVPAVAAIMGVSDQTVRDLIEKGDLPAVRFSARTIRVRRRTVAQYLADHTTGAKP